MEPPRDVAAENAARDGETDPEALLREYYVTESCAERQGNLLYERDSSGMPPMDITESLLRLRKNCWHSVPHAVGNSRPTASRLQAMYGLQSASDAMCVRVKDYSADKHALCTNCYRALRLPGRVSLRTGADRDAMETALINGRQDEANAMYGRSCRDYLRSGQSIRKGHHQEAVKRLVKRARTEAWADKFTDVKHTLADLDRLLGDF
jgi:hypothetical protein